jgi:hypothetical protein
MKLVCACDVTKSSQFKTEQWETLSPEICVMGPSVRKKTAPVKHRGCVRLGENAALARGYGAPGYGGPVGLADPRAYFPPHNTA